MPHHRTDQFPYDAPGPAVLQAGSAADLAAMANVDHQHGGQEADLRDREAGFYSTRPTTRNHVIASHSSR